MSATPRRRAPAPAWALRVCWTALPFTVGPALAAGLHQAGASARDVASIGLWAGWSVGLLAALVPHPLSLTALRLIAPAAIAAVVGAATLGGVATNHVGSVAVALSWAGVTGAWAFSSPVAEWCANGPAYPNEHRLPLRVPGPLLAGPLALAWCLVLAGLGAGPLLLGTRHWVLGTAALLVGLPVAALLLRSLHALSRRWAVFVPAGLVVHDPLSLVDPVLFRRATILSLRPSPRRSGLAVDLTQRALGLALVLALHEEVELSLLDPPKRGGAKVRAGAVRFTPVRPGAALAEARSRRYPTPAPATTTPPPTTSSPT
ncbi:MAG: hypothetical protein ACYDAD_06660 [Acidimicrobiales bacterium]